MPGRLDNQLPAPEPRLALHPAQRGARGQAAPFPPWPCRAYPAAADVAVPVYPVAVRTQVGHPVWRRAGPAPRDADVLQPDGFGGLFDLADLTAGQRPEQELLPGLHLLPYHPPGPDDGRPRDGRHRRQRMAEYAQSLVPVLPPVRRLASAEPHAARAPLRQVIQARVGHAVGAQEDELRLHVLQGTGEGDVARQRLRRDVDALGVLREDLPGEPQDG